VVLLVSLWLLRAAFETWSKNPVVANAPPLNRDEPPA